VSHDIGPQLSVADQSEGDEQGGCASRKERNQEKGWRSLVKDCSTHIIKRSRV